MNKYLIAIILMAVMAFINSCGTGDKVRAKKDMEASKAAYERCLEQHPDDPSKCEAWRKAYEADYRAYQEASKGGGPIPTAFIEFGPKK